MKKILIIFLLFLTSVTVADDQNRVMQILTIAKEINATDAQIALAIANNASPEEFAKGPIRLIAPDKAPKGSPIQISVEGLPEKVTELWRRHPQMPTDVWLELYDRNGKPINIFWSSDAGPRMFELIIAENGPEVPTIDIATHQLQYGPVPSDPVPNPPKPNIPEPSIELQGLVGPLLEFDFLAASQEGVLDTGDLLNLTEFYLDFASGVGRGKATIIDTTATFRTVYMNAGALMFQQTGMKGKYKNLGDTIDNILSSYMGLNVVKLDAIMTSDVLNAVAWAFYQQVK